MPARRFPFLVATALAVACSGSVPGEGSPGAVKLVQPNPDVAATAGSPFRYDATLGNTAFTGDALTYHVTFAPDANGLSAANGIISGTLLGAATTVITILARDARGSIATNTFTLVGFAPTLTAPVFPPVPYRYADAEVQLPAHFMTALQGGSVAATDNEPAGNPVTDAGAALGRVLFYDPRLSMNDRVSCASCHQQIHAFSDTARFSHGFQGGLTSRHSMTLANARYYQRGRFFWDERAATLEAQALVPIQNGIEMGLTLDRLVVKLKLTPYYPALFQAAFGSTEITSDRVGRAIAQFVRSITTYQSKYDRAFASAGPPDFSGLTADEMLGMELFMPIPGSPVQTVGCDRCHTTAAQVGDTPHNNGLDAVSADTGAGRGRFKAPSLRNVGMRLAFMHDGRFTTLRQVVEHYNIGVQPGPDLDPLLRNPDGTPRRLNLSIAQMDALVAFLNSLTDAAFLIDSRFSTPFR